MKKRIAISCIVFVLVIAVAGGYSAFNRVFPKAEQIEYPDIDSVISVTVSRNSEEQIEISTEKFETLVSGISSAKPTRRQSVNDYPTANPFYKIELKTKDRVYCYFVYEEGAVCIEMPYVGIYYSDIGFYNSLEILI